MIEKEYKLSRTNEKAIEKIIFDENLHYLHMLFFIRSGNHKRATIWRNQIDHGTVL